MKLKKAVNNPIDSPKMTSLGKWTPKYNLDKGTKMIKITDTITIHFFCKYKDKLKKADPAFCEWPLGNDVPVAESDKLESFNFLKCSYPSYSKGRLAAVLLFS